MTVVDADPRSMLSKAFAIVDALAGDDLELTLGRIADATGVPKSTVHRIVQELVGWGAIEQTSAGYRLGLHMFELGAQMIRNHDLRETALPFMEDLYEASHELVHLGLLDGGEVVYIEKIGGHQQASAPSRVGGRLPAYCTGIGKALLAFAPRDAVVTVLRRGLRPRTGYTITQPELLLRDLATIRERGVAYDREECSIGLNCVASPIVVDQRAVAALSVSGPTNRIDPERLATAVRAASIGIGRALRRNTDLPPG